MTRPTTAGNSPPCCEPGAPPAPPPPPRGGRPPPPPPPPPAAAGPTTTHRPDSTPDAAARWQDFGNLPERAYALLGQGRCLHAIGRLEGAEPLAEARDLFGAMGFGPAFAETELLLAQSAAAS